MLWLCIKTIVNPLSQRHYFKRHLTIYQAAARKEYAKTMREKTNKGYQVLWARGILRIVTCSCLTYLFEFFAFQPYTQIHA